MSTATRARAFGVAVAVVLVAAGAAMGTSSNSPCLPANNAWTVLMGAEGEGCGECDTAVEGTTWGRVKALYQ